MHFISGVLCDISLENACVDNPCQNGECVPGVGPGEFTCNCEVGYFGNLCTSRLEGEYTNHRFHYK